VTGASGKSRCLEYRFTWQKKSGRQRDRLVIEGANLDQTCRINAEAIEAFVEPKLDRILVKGLPHLLVLPVQIGLLASEKVQVVFLCRFVPFPDAPTTAQG
jgi:hypothetical protein